MKNQLIGEINRNRKLMNIPLLNEVSIPIPALFMRSSKLKTIYNKFLKTNADVKRWLDDPTTQRKYTDALNNIHAYIDIDNPLDKVVKFNLVCDYLGVTPTQLKNALGGLINHTRTKIGPKFNEIGGIGNQYDNEIQQYLADKFNNLNQDQRNVITSYFKTWVKVGGSFNQKFDVSSIGKLASEVDFNNKSILKILSLYRKLLFADIRKTRATLDAEILDLYYSYIDDSIKVLTTSPDSMDANTKIYAGKLNEKFTTYYAKFGQHNFDVLSNLIKTYKESIGNRPSYGDSSNVDLTKIEKFDQIIADLQIKGDKYTGARFLYYLSNKNDWGEVAKELLVSPFKKPEIQVKMKLKLAEAIVSFYNKVSSNPIGKYILWGPAANFNLYILALKQFKNLLQNESLETISKTEKGKMLIGIISSWLLFCFINLIRRVFYLIISAVMGVGVAGIIALQKIIGIKIPYSQESINKRDYNNDLSVTVAEAVQYQVETHWKKAVIKFSAESGFTFTNAFWNFVLPPEITNPEQGLIFSGARDAIEFLVNLDPNENVNYATFREAILGQITSKAIQGIKAGGQSIISGGGSGVNVSNPTWSYGLTIGSIRHLIINFDKTKIQSLLINRTINVNAESNLIKINANNQTFVNIPKNYTISTVQLTGKNGKKYNLTEK
jgi:hypothetical protein